MMLLLAFLTYKHVTHLLQNAFVNSHVWQMTAAEVEVAMLWLCSACLCVHVEGVYIIKGRIPSFLKEQTVMTACFHKEI